MRRILAAVVLLIVTAGCEKKPTPPTPTPGGSGGTISGAERLGWDQLASDMDELATFGYAIFVDGVRFEVAAVTCAGPPTLSGFACSGRLPAMSAGAHALQLSTFVVRNGATFESGRSATLNVVVAASNAGDRDSTPSAGATVRASGGAAFLVSSVAEGLEQPTDLAVAPDGRVFVAEATGRISMVATGRRRTALDPAPGARVAVLAVALDPQFARSRFVYVVRAVLDQAPPMFQLVRYREVEGTLGEAATLLDNVPLDSPTLARDRSAAVARPAAALRFGPDGRLYAAFEERTDAAPVEGGFNGKILRLNPDGTTPRDQRGATPVLGAGARRPRAIVWDAAGVRWIVDGDFTRAERLIGVPPAPAARDPSVSYVLPVPFGASSAVFHPTGDLLIGAEAGAYILRVRFDPEDRLHVLGTDRLLEGDVDSVRATAVTSDGSIYVCTSRALMALTPRTAPSPCTPAPCAAIPAQPGSARPAHPGQTVRRGR